MGRPITWQNVNGPSLSEAAAPLAAAQRSFDTAFSRVGDELVRREATNAQNYETGKVNNTEAFMAQLSQFRTPEELQAAQQSGVLDAMRQRFGAQVDQSAIRTAQDLRLGVLQERAQREGQFVDAQRTRTERPIVDEYNAALAAKDFIRARAILSSNPQLSNQAGMEVAFTAGQRALVTAEREDQKYGHEAALRPGVLKLQDATIAATNQRVTNEKVAAETAAAELVDRGIRTRTAASKEAREAEKAKTDAAQAKIKALTKDTVMDGGTLDTTEGKEAFNKALDGLKLNNAERIDIMHNLEQFAPGGVKTLKLYGGNERKVVVPASVAIEALRGSEENWLANAVPGWSRRGDDFDNLLTKRLMDTGVLKQIDFIQSEKGKLMRSLVPEEATAQNQGQAQPPVRFTPQQLEQFINTRREPPK